jgi:hypothetical protein
MIDAVGIDALRSHWPSARSMSRSLLRWQIDHDLGISI